MHRSRRCTMGGCTRRPRQPSQGVQAMSTDDPPQPRRQGHYRAGIIGLGGIAVNRGPRATHPALGKKHGWTHAAAHDLVFGTELVAICDLQPALIEQFRSKWGDAWPHLHTYTDYRRMLERERLDLVSVATSDHLYADMVVAAAEAGVRGIFCEKPIATSLAAADRMIAACKQHGAVLSVDYTRRFKGHWHEVQSYIRSGELGRLRAITFAMAYRLAMLFRNGSHFIDQLGFLTDNEAEVVEPVPGSKIDKVMR